MSSYETSATVEDHGQVHVAGVPFAPGTEVEVTISPKSPPEGPITPPADDANPEVAGLQWRGNVLVHQGVGAGLSVDELRNERLGRLA